MLSDFINKKSVGFSLIVFLALLVYYLTLTPTMFWIDAAIYLTTIKEFGIAYPPGFPLYIIVAKLWSFLPLPGFNFAQKINFLSSVFAGLTAGFLYLTIRKLFENNFSFFGRVIIPSDSKPQNRHLINAIAFFSALIFAFSHSLWYQATYSEVYTFHAFLAVLIIYFLVFFAKEGEIKAGLNARQKKFLFGVFLFYGLTFANHPMTVGFLPLSIWLIFSLKKAIPANKKFFIFLALVFLFSGFLPYVYIPFRSLQNPVMDWGNPENLKNFINHAAARHWTGQSNLFVLFDRKFFENLGNWLSLTYHQFYSIGIAFILTGVIYLFFKSRRIFNFLLSMILGAAFWGVVYITGEYESWLIPTYIVMAIFLAGGFYLFSSWILNLRLGRLNFLSKAAMAALLIFLTLSNLKNNWLTMDRSANFYPEEAGHNILKSVEDGSIVISEAGAALNSIIYNQMILGEKSDVIFIHRNSFWAPWMRQNLKKYEKEKGLFLPDLDISEENLKDKKKQSEFNNSYLEAFIRGNLNKFKIYTVMPDVFEEIKIIPAGFGYKYSFRDKEPNVDDWNFDFKISKFCDLSWLFKKECFETGMDMDNGKNYYQPPDVQIQSNKEFNEIRAGYASSYKNLADIFSFQKKFSEAAYYYERAVNLLNENFTEEQKFDIRMRLGVSLLNGRQYKKALDYFNDLNNRYPNNKEINYFLAAAYKESGMIKEAMGIIMTALKIDQNDKDFQSLLGIIIKEKGGEAIKYLSPENPAK